MFGEFSTTLRLVALVLILIGGAGNLGVALWYVWKKEDLKRGFLHVAIAVIVLLGLRYVLF